MIGTKLATSYEHKVLSGGITSDTLEIVLETIVT